MNEFKRYRKGMFESHANYLLKSFLNPWAKEFAQVFSTNLSGISNERCGLIIDDRANEMLRFSVLNTILMTKLSLPIKIYTTKKSLLKTKNLFSDIQNISSLIEINTLEVDRINIAFYNNLLKSSEFWSNLLARKILIFQTDALLIEPMEFSYFDYDYIGALFTRGKSRCINFPHFNKDSYEEVGYTWITQHYNENLNHEILMGNGGLSIRDCEIMKKICLNETSKLNENEDIFFSRFIRKYSKNLPENTTIINRFSIEADYHNSIGYHGSHFYLDHSELSNIYDRHIRNLIGLISSFN